MYTYKHLMLFLCVVCVSCASGRVYDIESIQGAVVDADTGNPLEGVVVVAFYEVEKGGWAGSVQTGYLEPVEAVTDSNGHYSMPALGKVDSTRFGGYISKWAPELYFYKFGFSVEMRRNNYREHDWMDDTRYSEWNSKTIELNRFEGSEEEYVNNISAFSRELEWAMSRIGPCMLIGVPMSLRELEKTKTTFKNPRSYNYVMDSLALYDKLEKCHGYKEFINAVKK